MSSTVLLALLVVAIPLRSLACDFDDLVGRTSEINTVQVVMPHAATNFHWETRRARPNSDAFPPLIGEVAKHVGLMYLFIENVVPVRFISQALKRGDAAIINQKGVIQRVYGFSPAQSAEYEERLSSVETVDGCGLLILPPGEFVQDGAVDKQLLRFIPAPEPTP